MTTHSPSVKVAEKDRSAVGMVTGLPRIGHRVRRNGFARICSILALFEVQALGCAAEPFFQVLVKLFQASASCTKRKLAFQFSVLQCCWIGFDPASRIAEKVVSMP